jgi:hypothetical protein
MKMLDENVDCVVIVWFVILRGLRMRCFYDVTRTDGVNHVASY